MSARAWSNLALTAALWGASYLFIKVALDDDVSEAGIIFSRTLLGAVVLVPLAVRAGAVPALLARPGWTVALALTQVVVPFALITWGENHVPTSLAGILVAAVPIFVALVAPWLDADERSTGWGLVGVLVGMAGVVLLFGADLGGGGGELAGGLMILGAALSYAVAVLIVKRGFTGVPPVGVAASTMVVSAAVWLLPALVTLPDHAPAAKTVGALLALGAGGTGLAFLLFYAVIAEFGPARASIVTYLAPAFAVLYGVTLLDETLGASTVAGLALILGGSWLAASARPVAAPNTAPTRS